ncbi:hypothetical protein VNO77_27244 [Canavalia gladiata]|uniref:Nuclear condensin complex subunit 3 C-terminal domain-containing protein n=1 Tax=Canavalia gladiata TaxID=3824 RepID=A0AAN9KYH6_CANGL
MKHASDLPEQHIIEEESLAIKSLARFDHTEGKIVHEIAKIKDSKRGNLKTFRRFEPSQPSRLLNPNSFFGKEDPATRHKLSFSPPFAGSECASPVRANWRKGHKIPFFSRPGVATNLVGERENESSSLLELADQRRQHPDKKKTVSKFVSIAIRDELLRLREVLNSIKCSHYFVKIPVKDSTSSDHRSGDLGNGDITDLAVNFNNALVTSSMPLYFYLSQVGDRVVYNNEKEGIVDCLKKDIGVVDLDSEISSLPDWIVTKAILTTWLADALSYELWVRSEGSSAYTIYYPDLPCPLGKVLFHKKAHWVKLKHGITNDNAELKKEEIYKRANSAYNALSICLGEQNYLFENRTLCLEAIFLAHGLVILQALHESSKLRIKFLEHSNLVRCSHLDVQRIVVRCLGLLGLLERKPCIEILKLLRITCIQEPHPIGLAACRALVDLVMWHDPQEVSKVLKHDAPHQVNCEKKTFSPVDFSDSEKDLKIDEHYTSIGILVQP